MRETVISFLSVLAGEGVQLWNTGGHRISVSDIPNMEDLGLISVLIGTTEHQALNAK